MVEANTAALNNHPEIILRKLDAHLQARTGLILYGRAALALGFGHIDPQFASTLDVDVILPRKNLEVIEADESFWGALENTNAELEPSGLYITHLFVEDQVILGEGWLDRIVPICLDGLRHLELARPATEDLILTKMMRVDPQDRSDILFLLGELSEAVDLHRHMASGLVPPIDELRHAYDENRRWLTGYLDGLRKPEEIG